MRHMTISLFEAVPLQYPADPVDAQSCISSTQFLLASKAGVQGCLFIGKMETLTSSRNRNPCQLDSFLGDYERLCA